MPAPERKPWPTAISSMAPGTHFTYCKRIGIVMNEKFSGAQPLWSRYAGQFPVRNRLIYLNHAAVAPLSKAAAEAMKGLADDCSQFGSLHYKDWLAVYEGLGGAAARLV